jgi:hypothetical protein
MSEICSDGFQEFTFLKTQLGVAAVFFILIIIVGIVWFIVRIRKFRENNVLKWYFFGIALILFAL